MHAVAVETLPPHHADLFDRLIVGAGLDRAAAPADA